MDEAKTYSYYPGCSLKSGGKAYEESLHAVFNTLNLHLDEISDWNCCGATTYFAIDEDEALALPARNLALSLEKSNGEPRTARDIVMPCSACYLAHVKAQDHLRENPDKKEGIRKSLAQTGHDLDLNVKIRHPLEVIINDVGLDKIKKATKRPLKNLNVVSNYGCQLVRPYEEFDDAHDPVTLDELMQATGAKVKDWSYKTKCCGGILMATLPEVGFDLNYQLLYEARRKDADVIVTTCPLCQFNLECYQDEISRKKGEDISMPILYFTQLVGMAFGIPDKQLGLHRQIVPLPQLTE